MVYWAIRFFLSEDPGMGLLLTWTKWLFWANRLLLSQAPVWSLAGWGACCTPIGRNTPVAELSKCRCAVICRNDPVADLSNCRTMLEWMSWYEGSFACIGPNSCRF
ncbi:hypothetical protein Nepgr_022970 [Nepenthes gracilis]|uniref:Uncharacterized protein n=1 Tax=Nepenthes gracilis TaxID=150966 RepID=A0AAD3T183_NEPGR|nr:hypothetical protein Nepgr_022970 [Nepenthes gracilis]